MAVKLLILVIACGAIAAGSASLRTARRMSSYKTTRGTVLTREVTPVDGTLGREGRWGNGGAYQPKVTYTYLVDGVVYTCDRWSYVVDGLKRSVAEQLVTTVPDEVDVHYDPAAPQTAYLQLQSPRVGYGLIAGGMLGVLVAVVALLG